MIKILVTGGNGQLAQCLKDIVKNNDELDVDFQDLPYLDITNKQQLESYFSKNEFDYCINCAAYTAVDLAEEQSDLAYAVNAEGPKNLAEVCKKYQVKLLHISTDFVFDGQKRTPYLETDMPNPLGVYGASKWQGERYIQEVMEDYFIIRTSWLYSEYGNNFMKTMLRLSETRDEISVVSDKIGAPTYAGDLAEVLIKIVLSSS
ncbi:MAG: dTDP-4-dehydrorhamnose reductase, partial [Flavobacteriaceae bacterium]